LPTFLTIAQFELTRVLLTRRGMVSILAFALIWFVVLRYAIYPASRFLGGSGSNSLIGLLLGEINLGHLAEWSVPELSVYWLISLLLLPLFCIALTADQTASDRARGTLRFLHLRATRSAIFFGRFAGQMFIQWLLIVITGLSTFALALYRDPALLSTGIDHFVVIVVNLTIVLLPYTALMAMVSIASKSARQATVYAIILWIVFMLLIRYLQAKFPDLVLLDWILPGSQIKSLVQLQSWDTLSLAPIPLIQCAILLFVGWLIMRRIDL